MSDLLDYIEKRKDDIRKEQKRIHVFPPNRRELVRRQLRGRVLELERLRILIEQGELHE
jgi:hypothetical protein